MELRTRQMGRGSPDDLIDIVQEIVRMVSLALWRAFFAEGGI